MIVKKIKIQIDHLFLYGELSGPASDSLVIIVNGMTENMHGELYVSVAEYLNSNGFSVLRYNQYGDECDTRKLADSTIKIQTADLKKVISEIGLKYDNVYLVGHSFAAASILSLEDDVCEAVVLLDPMYRFSFFEKNSTPPRLVEEDGVYILDWSPSFAVSKEIVDEIESFPWNEIAEKFTPPVLIISAPPKNLESSKGYFKNVSLKQQYIEIQNANHHFDNSLDIRKALLSEILNWINKNKACTKRI